MLKEKLDHYGVSNYFVFDMSIPDSLSYSNESMIFYTRQSELEKKPALYEDSFGVWLDSFYSDWIDTDTIAFHQNNNKKICIVSPELHGRPHEQAWSKYKGLNLSNPELCFFLCTDFPIEARSYFEY
jgi:hypothetical protein